MFSDDLQIIMTAKGREGSSGKRQSIKNSSKIINWSNSNHEYKTKQGQWGEGDYQCLAIRMAHEAWPYTTKADGTVGKMWAILVHKSSDTQNILSLCLKSIQPGTLDKVNSKLWEKNIFCEKKPGSW